MKMVCLLLISAILPLSVVSYSLLGELLYLLGLFMTMILTMFFLL